MKDKTIKIRVRLTDEQYRNKDVILYKAIKTVSNYVYEIKKTWISDK